MRLGGFGRVSLSISSAIVLVAALALPAITLGASPKVTFGAEWDGLRLGGACVGGHGPSGAALHLVWKSSAGAVKANTYLATNNWGDWSYCSDGNHVLAAGDVLKATVDATTRKFVMPLLTINVDRVDEVFRGSAPAGTTFDLWYSYRGCCPDSDQHVAITADAAGRWLYDGEDDGEFTYGAEGYDAHVNWISAKGDHVSGESRAVEATVRINRSVVAGYGDPFSDWKLALWDTVAGVRKGVATGVVDGWGSFSGVFLDADGDPVEVLAGDRIVGRSLAADLRFVARDIQASADVATDIVTGTCGNTGGGGHIAVYRRGNEIGWSLLWDIDAQGNFSIPFGDEPDLGYDPANIRHGDRLLVTCGTAKGDFVEKWFPVP